MPPLPQPDHANCLVVEGPDDKGVCLPFIARHGLEVYVQVEDGYETLRVTLPNRLREPGRHALGVVVDADESMAGRWQSLRDAVAPLGYTLPDQPDPEGTVVEAEGKPRLGLWLMPDNRLNGVLEDFVRFLVPKGDVLFEHAGAVLANIPERRFQEIHQSKALIHTWLAWQAEPGRPMGQAITKRFLDCDGTVAQTFSAWLARLFA